MSSLTWVVQTSTPYQLHDPTNGLMLLGYGPSGKRRRFTLADPSDMLNGDQVNAANWASNSNVLRLRVFGNSIAQWKTRLDALEAELSKKNLSISIACNGTTLETWQGVWLEEFGAIGMGSDSQSGHSKFGFMAAQPKQDYEFKFMSVVPV